MVTGEDEVPKDKGWSTSDGSWLDLEEEENGKIFHVNVIMEEVEHSGEAASSPCLADEDVPYKGRNNRFSK
jgi:hypothetical protein